MDTYCKTCNKKVDEKSRKKSESESEDEVIKIKIYCLKCKKHTSSDDLKKIDMDGKIQIKADCVECNAGKSRFVSKEDEDKIENRIRITERNRMEY